MSKETRLATFGLSKAWPGERSRGYAALEHVDMVVQAGEVAVVEGGPLSGRTTLLRCLAGAIAADAGRCLLTVQGETVEVLRADGRTLSWLRRHHVRFHRPPPAAWHRLGAWVPPTRALGRAGESSRIARRRSLEALRHLRIDGDQCLGALSPPDAHLVGLVTALLPPAAMVLLDEPLAGVDPAVRGTVLDLMKDAARRGASVVATDGTGGELGNHADTVHALHQGVLL